MAVQWREFVMSEGPRVVGIWSFSGWGLDDPDPWPFSEGALNFLVGIDIELFCVVDVNLCPKQAPLKNSPLGIEHSNSTSLPPTDRFLPSESGNATLPEHMLRVLQNKINRRHYYHIHFTVSIVECRFATTTRNQDPISIPSFVFLVLRISPVNRVTSSTKHHWRWIRLVPLHHPHFIFIFPSSLSQRVCRNAFPANLSIEFVIVVFPFVYWKELKCRHIETGERESSRWFKFNVKTREWITRHITGPLHDAFCKVTRQRQTGYNPVLNTLNLDHQHSWQSSTCSD